MQFSVAALALATTFVVIADDGHRLKHPDWHPGGVRIIAEGSCAENIGLYLIDTAGQTIQKVFDSGNTDGYPRWFPDGRSIAFHQIDAERRARIYVGNLSDEGQWLGETAVTDGPFDIEPAPSPDGHRLAHTQPGEAGLDVALLDVDSGARRTWPTPSAENFPSWDRSNGTLIFHARDDEMTQIYRRDLSSGALTPITTADSPNFVADIDASGKRMVFSSERDGDREIYIRDLDAGTETRLTRRAGRDGYPKFSPDGARIAYHAEIDGRDTIVRILDLATRATTDYRLGDAECP